MKRILLALCLAGLPALATAQVDIGAPADLTECDANADGYAMFNLSANDVVVLNGLSPSEYTVKYYETSDMAETDTDALPDAYYNNIASNTQTIYVRVTEIANPSNYAVSSFEIIASTGFDINNPSPLKGCAGVYPNNQVSVFDLTSKVDEITNGCSTCTVTFYKPNNTVISNPVNFTGGSQVLNVVVQSMDGCTENTTLNLEIIPRPAVPLYPRILSCNGIFNLTENNELIAPGHVVSFYVDLDDAEMGTNAIANPQNFQGNVSFVFVRVEADSNQENAGCYTVTEVLLTHADGYNPLYFTYNLCRDFETGELLNETVIEIDINEDVFTIEWFLDGVILDGITGDSCTAMEEGTYSFVATHNVTGCVVSDEALVIELNPPVANANSIEIVGDTITVSVDGNDYGYYVYRIDGGEWQDSNVFTDVIAGEHTIEVANPCGFNDLMFTIVIEGPLPPVAPPNQSLPEGSTLADLEIEGENIQWYGNPGVVGPPNGMDGDNPLSITTFLQDGVTYYASQTINGVESQRTGVTISTILSSSDNLFSGFDYYPNPVSDILNVKNNNAIDRATIYNSLGQKVAETAPAATEAQISLAGLSDGIYVVKIASGGKEKAIKVVKQ